MLRIFLFLTALLLPMTAWAAGASVHCDAPGDTGMATRHTTHGDAAQAPQGAVPDDHQCTHCPPADCARMAACASAPAAIVVISDARAVEPRIPPAVPVSVYRKPASHLASPPTPPPQCLL